MQKVWKSVYTNVIYTKSIYTLRVSASNNEHIDLNEFLAWKTTMLSWYMLEKYTHKCIYLLHGSFQHQPIVYWTKYILEYTRTLFQTEHYTRTLSFIAGALICFVAVCFIFAFVFVVFCFVFDFAFICKIKDLFHLLKTFGYEKGKFAYQFHRHVVLLLHQAQNPKL